MTRKHTVHTIDLNEDLRGWLERYLEGDYECIGHDLYGHGPQRAERIRSGEYDRRMILRSLELVRL